MGRRIDFRAHNDHNSTILWCTCTNPRWPHTVAVPYAVQLTHDLPVSLVNQRQCRARRAHALAAVSSGPIGAAPPSGGQGRTWVDLSRLPGACRAFSGRLASAVPPRKRGCQGGLTGGATARAQGSNIVGLLGIIRPHMVHKY